MAIPLMAGLMVAQGVMGLVGQGAGMLQQHKMADENEKMAEKMSADTSTSSSAITSQFEASSGLSGNLGDATGDQQMDSGSMPPFMQQSGGY